MIRGGDYWYSYEDGTCPVPQVYDQETEPVVIFDADGEPLVQEKIKMGFDLRVKK